MSRSKLYSSIKNQIVINKFNHNALIVLLTLPIVIELLRKYFLFSNLWFIALDISLFVIFIRTLLNFKPHLIFRCWVFVLTTFILHGLIFSIIEHKAPLSVLFGFRLAFYPLVAFLVVSSVDFNEFFTQKIIKLSLFLLITISLFGLLQIFLGMDHLINYVPNEVTYGRSKGYGGYDQRVNDMFSINLFRPHSIFLHTGKFGQVVWGLSVFLLVISSKLSERKKVALMLLIVFCNVVTGQRAALYSLIAFIALYSYISSKSKPIFIMSMLLIFSFLYILNPENITLMTARFFSAIPEIPERIDIVLFSASDLLNNGIFGDGWGYYSTGAQAVGGGNYSDHFGGEGGWIIIASEVGIPIAISLFLVNLIIAALIFSRVVLRTNDRYLSFWTGYVILLIPLWALTHNIFGSYLFMLYAVTPIGLYYNNSVNFNIKNRFF